MAVAGKRPTAEVCLYDKHRDLLNEQRSQKQLRETSSTEELLSSQKVQYIFATSGLYFRTNKGYKIC